MRLNKILLPLLAVISCTLILSSCTKSPKIDLNGVGLNPALAGVEDDANGAGASQKGGSFIPSEIGIDDEDPGLMRFDGDDDMKSMQAPVETGSEGGDFVKNGKRWQGVVYFGYDQADIPPSERAKLDTLAEFLNTNPTLGIVIEGNTDERGSDEYNRALGERRAISVQQYLGLLGVSDARMKTLSNGEDKPAVVGAATDQDHARNRRAEFVIGTL